MNASLLRRWGLLGLLALLLLGACGRKAEAPEAVAKRFLEDIAGDRFPEAYKATALAFQLKQDATGFAGKARDLSMVGAKAIEVKAPTVEGKTARLDATVTAANGDVLPLKMQLLQEKGTWQVFSIRSTVKSRSGLPEELFTKIGQPMMFRDTERHPLPPEEKVRSLVQGSLNGFAQAVERKNFARFYKDLSALAQGRISQEKLERSFQGFIERAAELRQAVKGELVFTTAPYLNGEGWLIAEGEYRATPKLTFAMKYVYELPDWRLLDMNVQLDKKDGDIAPGPPQ